MTLFRGYGGDLPLMRWLQEKIWPVEAKLEAEDVYWGTRLACAGDDPHRHRPLLGHVLAARRRPRGRSPTPACGRRSAAPLFDADGEHRARCRRRRWPSLDELAELGPPRSSRALAPHSIYTVSEELAALDRRARRRARGCRSRSTSPRPSRRSRTASPPTAMRPAAYLDRLGAARRAHGARPRRLARPRRARADRRARRHRRHQPGRQHEARGRRRLPLPGGARGGRRGRRSAPTAPAPTTRSTCSPTSRPSPWPSATPPADPTVAPGAGGAGRSRPAPAPRCSAPASRSRSAPRPTSCCCAATRHELGLGDLASDLVYAASGSVVDTTVVAGRPLMRDGRIDGAEETIESGSGAGGATRNRVIRGIGSNRRCRAKRSRTQGQPPVPRQSATRTRASATRGSDAAAVDDLTLRSRRARSASSSAPRAAARRPRCGWSTAPSS